MKIKRVVRFSERVFTAILKLLPQLASERELPSEEYFKSLIASKQIHLFVAELDDHQIVGMLTIATYKIPTGLKIWIEDVVVDASQRGKGIGKDLINFALDYSKTLGADSVALTSRPSRVEANELYKKIGFVQYETNVYKFRLKS